MKKNAKFLSLLLASSMLFSSCGVMFGGSKYVGVIQTRNHPDADIYVGGRKLGTGSATSLFPRNKELVVELKQEGCETHTRTFDKSFRTGNFILSVLMWGLVGAIVDLGTGAAYKPETNSDPDVVQKSTKNFYFTVDYPDCPPTEQAINRD